MNKAKKVTYTVLGVIGVIVVLGIVIFVLHGGIVLPH